MSLADRIKALLDAPAKFHAAREEIEEIKVQLAALEASLHTCYCFRMQPARSNAKLASKLWRLDNLYFIKTKDMRQVPLQLNRAQRDFLTRRTLKSFIPKARQLGFTTGCLIDMLDDTIFTPK